MSLTNVMMVYALACWTYTAVDMWRQRREARDFILQHVPGVESIPPAVVWLTVAMTLALAPFFAPFDVADELISFARQRGGRS